MLFSAVRIQKPYPSVQIFASLTQLVDSKEPIVDKYGRIGTLINIREYYLFQPSELTDTHISAFDRMVPIDIKPPFVQYNLKSEKKSEKEGEKGENGTDELGADDEQIQGNQNEQQEQGKLGFDTIVSNLHIYQEIAAQPTFQVRGNMSWFKHCGSISAHLVSEYPGIPMDFFVLDHQIEMLNFEDKVNLMNYIYSNSQSTDKSITHCLTYFETLTYKAQSHAYCIMTDDTAIKCMKYEEKGGKGEGKGEWIVQLPEETREILFFPETKRFMEFRLSEYNAIIGFLGFDKNNEELVFKTKSIAQLRNTGARCSEAGKKKTIELLNTLVGNQSYTDSSINQIGLCIIQEMVLRYFHHTRKNEKKWFIPPEMAIYNNMFKMKHVANDIA